MADRSGSLQGFSAFVETVMCDKSYRGYRSDVRRLLYLLSKTLRQSPHKPWYKSRYDVLGNHCHYLAVKMLCDRRETVNRAVPQWLNMLAGRYDVPGYLNERGKVETFLALAAEFPKVAKKYGPDSVTTLRPPPAV